MGSVLVYSIMKNEINKYIYTYFVCDPQIYNITKDHLTVISVIYLH